MLRLGAALLALGPGLFARSALAHTLDVTTARISLRDGHVDVVAEVDVVHLLTHLVAEPKDETSIATASDAALAHWVAQARMLVEAGARLDADGVQVDLALQAFPTSQEIRFLAAQASASHRAHASMSTLRYESTRPAVAAQSISVALPSSLGPVLYTYVQPQTRLVSAGASASFAVLSVPRSQAPKVAASSSGRSWLALGAAVLAALALLAQLLPRRSTAHCDGKPGDTA